MPKHVHILLIEPQKGTLADALKSSTQGVSRRLIVDADRRRVYPGGIRHGWESDGRVLSLWWPKRICGVLCAVGPVDLPLPAA
jgi:hypothetical protein